MNKGFWISKDAGSVADGEMTYDNSSRIEPKRPHQWFMDGVEAELFPNKKQAIEVPSSHSFAGIPAANISPWGNLSSFHSVHNQFTDRFFDSGTTKNLNFNDRSIPSISTGNMNIGRKDVEDPFGCDSSFGLSISHTLEDPRNAVNYGGIRKVKVSQVRDSDNIMPVSSVSACSREQNYAISTTLGYNKVDNSGIPMGLSYSRGQDNVMPLGESYSRQDDNFISMGQSYNKVNDNSITLGPHFKADGNSMVTGTISVSHAFSGGDNVISVGQTFNKDNDNAISMSNIYSGVDASTVTMSHSNDNGDNSCLSVGRSFDKGESNIISFGGLTDDDDANASGRLICSYDLLMGQSSVQRSDVLDQKDFAVSDVNALVSTAQAISSGSKCSSKRKDDQKSSKSVPPNNFPSNVRSLLSTGMLDGVPVKYIAWSREKKLRGVIKGSGYLCGCQSCNFSKVINAYEFERHAGCKTKHPNNHIYFENGKTIYGIVQELRSTPQNILFDVIQTITGSPINQKSFRIWKESFLAATRELQRIYGKDDGNQPF